MSPSIFPTTTNDREHSRRYWQVIFFVLIVATGLRGALAFFNREANDNHYEVVQLILDGRSDLTMRDCHECFHPKLFYHACAVLIRALGFTNEGSQIVAGQLLNSVAGVITLVLVLAAIHWSQLLGKWKLWVFSLIALNPRIIAINGQLSNDSFAILFATAAIFSTLLLLRRPTLWLGVATQVMLACALMTKGTTWVVAIAIMIVFFVRALRDEIKQSSRLFAILYAVSTVNSFVSVQLAGYDFEHYDVYANMGRGQPLNLWEKTSVGRPGVQSIVDGYLTFRIVSLLRDPQITNGTAIEQLHRTSVWTQLYARANFAQFEQHPPSWVTTDRRVMLVAKLCMILGLVPLMCLLVGLGRGVFRSIQAWQDCGVPFKDDYSAFLNLLVCLGYIAFIIKFTADYRDFAAMKLIYLLPGVLPFSVILLNGMQWVGDRYCRVSIVDRMFQVLLGGLIVLYVTNILALVAHLASRS